ncbi:hypothetical protein C0995_015661, partial [Termitomyces sp. Mi166
MVEAAKAYLMTKGLPTAYYQLEGGNKVEASCYAAVSPVKSRKRSAVKSKKVVDNRSEEETQVKEMKRVKQEHGKRKELKRKRDAVKKKLTLTRPQASQSIMGPPSSSSL